LNLQNEQLMLIGFPSAAKVMVCSPVGFAHQIPKDHCSRTQGSTALVEHGLNPHIWDQTVEKLTNPWEPSVEKVTMERGRSEQARSSKFDPEAALCL
jgi:hypothetical protein